MEYKKVSFWGLFAVIVILSFLVIQISQNKKSTNILYKGKIIDTKNTKILNSRIFLYDDNGKKIAETKSDLDGNFDFIAKPGQYELCIVIGEVHSEKIVISSEPMINNKIIRLEKAPDKSNELWGKILPIAFGAVLGAILGFLSAQLKLHFEKEQNLKILKNHLFQPLINLIGDMKKFIIDTKKHPLTANSRKGKEEITNQFSAYIKEIETLLELYKKTYGSIFATLLPMHFPRILDANLIIFRLKKYSVDKDVEWIINEELFGKLVKEIEQITLQLY